MSLLIATCRALPEPDPDQTLLLEALARRGTEARLGAWDDPSVRWAEAALVVLRSTWDYYRSPEAFLAWAERTSRVSRLVNPLEVVRWNHHKRYLLALEAAGVPVVPTEFFPKGAAARLGEIAGRRGWREIVVKPAISASSYRTGRFRSGEEPGAESHLESLLAERDVLVQQYLPSVEDYGERALVWIDGEFTHAVRKAPRLMGEDESVSEALPLEADERRVGEAALACVDSRSLLYARVDLARDERGSPRVMELELIEPSLFLAQHPPALARLVEGIRALLEPPRR